MGNQYIDVQAPWSLRKTDTERMATVLWVLLESMRFVGILYQPVVPSISAALLDQLGAARRPLVAALAPGNELVGGAPLPTPAIIIPRYEKEEDAAAAPPPPPKAKKKAKKEQKPLSPAAAAQAAEVRRLKEEEGSQLRPEGRGRRRRAAPAKGGGLRRDPVFIRRKFLLAT